MPDDQAGLGLRRGTITQYGSYANFVMPIAAARDLIRRELCQRAEVQAAGATFTSRVTVSAAGS